MDCCMFCADISQNPIGLNCIIISKNEYTNQIWMANIRCVDLYQGYLVVLSLIGLITNSFLSNDSNLYNLRD